MKNFMRIDTKKRQIIMDKTFYNRSLYFGTEEYNLLQMARKDYPGFTPVRREIRKPDHPTIRPPTSSSSRCRPAAATPFTSSLTMTSPPTRTASSTRPTF